MGHLSTGYRCILKLKAPWYSGMGLQVLRSLLRSPPRGEDHFSLARERTVYVIVSLPGNCAEAGISFWLTQREIVSQGGHR